MMASRVFLIIMLAMFGFMLSNIEAAAIICGDDSTQTKTEPAVAATSGATAILEATNEKSLPNQEISDALAAELPTTTTETTTTTTTTSTESSEVKKIFKTVQCSLEKARPWVEEIEKEAKRLEETAKRISEGVISKLGDFVGRLTSSDENTNPTLRLFNRFITGIGVIGNVNKKVKQPIPAVVIEKEQEQEQVQEQEHEQVLDQKQELPVTEIIVSSSSTTTSSTTPAIVALIDVDESENQIDTDEK